MTFNNSANSGFSSPNRAESIRTFSSFYTENHWVKLLLSRVFNCIHRKLQISTSFVMLTESMSMSILAYSYKFTPL